MPFDYKLDDVTDEKSVIKANITNQTHGGGALKTTQSQESEQRAGLTTYGLSDAMQGIALYKPAGATYDAFNNHLSSELEKLGTEDKWKDRANKLTPYDVFIKDPTTTPTGTDTSNIASTAAQSSTSSDPSTSTPSGSSSVASGSLQELAGKVLNHPNVTFDPGRVKSMFVDVAGGKSIPMGSGTAPDATLLGLVCGIADRMKIQISSWVRPEDGGQGHGGGRCVDIDGCDGSLGINGSDERSNKIVAAAIDLIPDDGSFTLGFGRGSRSTPIPGGVRKGVYDFNDNPNHVHIQIDHKK